MIRKELKVISMPDNRKKQHMESLTEYLRRFDNRRIPVLRQLFLELTLRCNEHCYHCGSSCGDVRSEEMTAEEYRSIIDQVRRDFSVHLPQINITGGEPMIRDDFYDIVGYIGESGFVWGMTTNGVLIDADAVERLHEAGMRTISISIDGLEATHDRLRSRRGAFRKSIKAIELLTESGYFESVMPTTIVNHYTIRELDALSDIMNQTGVSCWRIGAIEPIGRAALLPDYWLTRDDYIYLMNFIMDRRARGENVSYSCCHYLGPEYEHEVRDWYWYCSAGISVAGIMSNGDIGACLSIGRNQKTVFGNIHTDRLLDVWEKEYGIYRKGLAVRNDQCRKCEDSIYCRGGAAHSWDFQKECQKVCLKGTLF